MEAQYKTRNGRLVIKCEAEKPKDLFRQLAMVCDVFDAEDSCGLCNSKNIQFRTRAVENGEYFDLHCEACGAQFDFGQHKNGSTLFAKRRGEGGSLANRGWHKWEGR